MSRGNREKNVRCLIFAFSQDYALQLGASTPLTFWLQGSTVATTTSFIDTGQQTSVLMTSTRPIIRCQNRMQSHTNASVRSICVLAFPWTIVLSAQKLRAATLPLIIQLHIYLLARHTLSIIPKFDWSRYHQQSNTPTPVPGTSFFCRKRSSPVGSVLAVLVSYPFQSIAIILAIPNTGNPTRGRPVIRMPLQRQSLPIFTHTSVVHLQPKSKVEIIPSELQQTP